MVLSSPHFSSSHSCVHRRQLTGGRAQPSQQSDARVGTQPFSVPSSMPLLGHSGLGCFCDGAQQEVSSLRLQSGTGSALRRGCFHDLLENGPSLPFPPIPVGSQDNSEAFSRSCPCDPHSALLATPAVVSHPARTLIRLHQAPLSPRPPFSGCGEDSPPRYRHNSSHSVENMPEIKEILDKSRKDSTSLLYGYKWKSFLKFTSERGLPSSPTSLSALLQFLRYLFDFHLSVSTLKVYIAAIVSFQPTGSSASRLFSHPTVKTFLKGVAHARPPVKRPVPQWSLHLVLQALMRPPFEPLATCDLKMLSFKVLFLVAITSARRASELAHLELINLFYSSIMTRSSFIQMSPFCLRWFLTFM
uniref:Uncharacterized protein n=1 Tax=Pogona vitticeps TaxID=103695 RepID=A0ABM5FV79_9SAUR